MDELKSTSDSQVAMRCWADQDWKKVKGDFDAKNLSAHRCRLLLRLLASFEPE